MLTSHTGFALGTHYCGGFAMDTKAMIGHIDLDCGMGDMDKDCESDTDPGMHFEKVPCCENEYLSIEIEDEFKSNMAQAKVNIAFIASFVFSLSELYTFSENSPEYFDYDPPMVEEDISLLHQVFLI